MPQANATSRDADHPEDVGYPDDTGHLSADQAASP